jgi:LCP family protein required for cell wall assembly
LRPGRRTAIVAGCIALALLLLLALAVFSNFGRQITGGITARIAMGNSPVNVLLIANNARDVAADDPLGLGSAAGQADVIILARLDPGAHTIYAITIPRDTLFAQPGWHDTVPKIKTLFFMGDQETPPRGPQYLAKAVERLTGLPVDGYIVANFAGFKEAVNLVGGITVDVKARVYDPQNSGADFEPGVQHMNGAQALAFVRVRQNEAGNDYRVNDFQRMQAEVQVLGLLRNKLLDPLRAPRLIPMFVARMKRDVATNLSQDRLIRIGIAMAGAPVFQIPLGSVADSMQLAPATVAGVNAEGRIDGADYDVLDPSEIQQRLAQFGSHFSSTGLPAQPAPKSVAVVLYGTSHMALHFKHLGFSRTVLEGSATGQNEVIYPEGGAPAAWLVARALGTGEVYVTPGSVDAITVYE